LPFFFGEFVMKEYKTVEKAACDEFVEKKSRFIGYVMPVKTAEEAVDFVNSVKSKHWDASHNVYAYILKENNIQRCSDDGEPSGTAGVPVLDVLLKNGLVDVCVVVTRYFGGTLLGAGGLVRAYSHCSKIAVDAGNIITMALCKILTASVDYAFYERLCTVLNEFGANIENTDFSDKVTVIFTLQEKSVFELNKRLVDVSNGMYSINEIGEKFAKI